MREGLTIEIVGDELVISIDKKSLAMGIELCPDLEYYDPKTDEFKLPLVTDKDVFMKEVMYALHNELDESGTTPVTKMFDSIFVNDFAENGLEGVVFHDYPEYEKVYTERLRNVKS
jgi:hypothetical protein